MYVAIKMIRTSRELIVARPDIKTRELHIYVSNNQMNLYQFSLLNRLIMHLRRLNVSRNRVCQVSKFTNIRSSSDIKTFCVIVQRRVSRGERRRETTVHSRIDKFGTLGEHQLSDMMQCKT